jgi:CRP-like cAMP-binding protein
MAKQALAMDIKNLDQTHNTYKELISRLRDFHQITMDDEKLIVQAFKKQRFKAGEWLIKPGKVTCKLFFVMNGILKVTVRACDDREEVFSFVQKYTFVTFLYSVYSNTPSYHCLQAACDTEVLMLDDRAWNNLYAHLPYLRTVFDQIQILFMADMFFVKIPMQDAMPTITTSL